MRLPGDGADEALDRLLAGLSQTKPPPGMEARLLAVLRQPAVDALTSRHRGWAGSLVSGARPTRVRLLAAGSLAAAVVVVLLLHLPAPRRAPQTPPASHQPHGARSISLPATAELDGKKRGARGDTAGAPKSRRLRRGQLSAESQLASFAPSFPPPPMPLTEQERLMLRIVRRGDAVQIAALDPAVRAAQDADERAEFQRFFELKKTGDHK